MASGGLGIRLATDIALPAFLSSAHGASGGMSQLLPGHESSTNEVSMLLIKAEELWSECLNNNVDHPLLKSVQAA